MVPFTRKLRPRVRRLPKPPESVNQLQQNIKIVESSENKIYIDNKNISRLSASKKEFESSDVSEEKILTNLESKLNQRKSVLDEIDDILKDGIITKNLTKTTLEPTHDEIDYTRIKQSQFLRAVQDYQAAGRTFSDSGLYNNASISYTCAVLAKLLASTSINEAYKEFQRIITIIQDKQIIRSSAFSILNQLFESLAKKDDSGLKRQLEKLKLIETFSTDDQELIHESIQFLLKI